MGNYVSNGDEGRFHDQSNVDILSSIQAYMFPDI